jgi:hypothetical protein
MSVVVVVVQEVGEDFLAGAERCVGAVAFALRAGQCEAEFGEALEHSDFTLANID